VATKATTTFAQHDSCAAKKQQSKPSNTTNNSMVTICQEYKVLYTSNKPPNAPIQTYIQYDILDNAPQKEEIVQALQKMKV
jgi:hypothetical protein